MTLSRQVPVAALVNPRALIATVVVLLMGILSVPIAKGAENKPTSPGTNDVFRFGLSSATFMDVNENDAKAAMKVWAQTLFRERGLPVDPEPLVLKDQDAIADALRNKLVDAITLNTDEFWKLDEDLRSGPFIIGLNEGRISEEYVLLVHQDSKLCRIEDLRGCSLNFYQNSRMSLAGVWLDTILLKEGFPRASDFCRTTRNSKLSKVLLPVFFRQADACVVTLRGFKTMSELNPQVSHRLKILTSSPELIPTGFCFRRDYNNPIRGIILSELAKIKDSPAGAQVLTLFQSGSLEAHPLECLDSSFELLALHQRLCGQTNQIKPDMAGMLLDAATGRRK